MQNENEISGLPFTKHKLQLIMVSIGLLVYFNGLFGSFVWDDIYQIQNNYLVHSITNIVSFFLGSTFTPENSRQLGGVYYRPMMSLAFSIIYSLFGAQTFPYHLFQLSIHLLNVLLIFYLFTKFFNKSLAFFLSLIFLVHPINVESIAYISTLEEPLFFLFGIVAFLLFFSEKITIKKSILISFMLLCSLLSKETGILFGLIVPLYYFFFKKTSYGETIKTLSIIVMPLTLYLFLRFSIAKIFLAKLPDVPMMTASFAERVFTMPAIFFFYIKTFFFPNDLFIYQEWFVSGSNYNFYLPLFLDVIFISMFCGVGIWLWGINKKQFSLFLFFALWFLIGIGFVMQILPLDMTVADHMFYFPMVGLLGIIGISLKNIKLTNQTIRNIGVGFAVLFICLLSLRTIIRNTNWYNGLSLYSHDLQYEQNDRLENLLAGALVEAGQYTQAQKYFEELLYRNPNQPALVFNLALIYEFEGNFQNANNLYQRNLSIDDSGVLYSNYARILMLKEGKVQQAKAISGEGLSKFSQNTTITIVDAIATYKLGNKQKALEELKHAEKISSDTRINQIYQGIESDNLNL